MCACANKGEKFNFWENQKLVKHRALRVHTFGESCTGKGEMHSVGVSTLFSSWFPSASGMTVSSPASVFEESCLCLIDCVEPLPLSEGIGLCLVKWLVLASFELLSLVQVTSWLFVLHCFCFNLGSFVVCWQCTHQGGDWGMLSTLSCLWWVNY